MKETKPRPKVKIFGLWDEFHEDVVVTSGLGGSLIRVDPFLMETNKFYSSN